MAEFLFERLCLIGVGLIGSSIARAARAKGGIARTIVAHTRRPETLARVRELGFADVVEADAGRAVEGADCVILSVPVGAYAGVMRQIAPHLSPGCILSDAGSTKGSVIRDLKPLLPAGVHLVPAHPMAGTEHSGPDAGFAELFENRYVIVTPVPGGDAASVERIAEFWRRLGSMVERMDAETHDKVVAIVSHLPHLIAFTICGTADDLAEETREAVLKFAASGFRDFTRIAASDVDMWRDIFLNNREAVLEMLGRFSEDLTALQRAIRWGEGEKLEDWFTRTRAIRRSIIDAKQA
jgi:cyclohexadieny/prephenate dehydrogenase